VRRLLIALATLVVLLAVADRVGVVLAERALAGQVRTDLGLSQTPDVSIRGIPFLTQAIRGRYSEVHVLLPDVDAGRLQNVRVDATLRGVRASLPDVLRRQVTEVPVDEVSGDLTVSYADLARASRISGLRIVREAEALRVSGTVRVLGRDVDASAVGRVEVDGNNIVIVAEEAQVAGVRLPPQALRAAARLLSFSVAPTGLPLSLRITGVRLGDEALEVTARSDETVLRR
jgi:hypothetical protein